MDHAYGLVGVCGLRYRKKLRNGGFVGNLPDWENIEIK